jgi:hypothetical protein
MLKNIEKTRNTEEQLSFYGLLENFIGKVNHSEVEKFQAFPVYTPRQIITAFLERYELYKLIEKVPGSIIECGVGSGLGLMSFAHFCSIFEPYHYVRHIIGFDTFEGFTELDEKDKGGKAEHMKKGGLSFDTYDILKEAIQLYDQNRTLGHINKIQLVKGDISATLPPFLEKNPHLVISLLYLDMDLYRPTKDTIELLLKRIPKGGMIVFDEINHGDYPGETIALMESIGIANLRLQRLPMSSMTSYAIIE